MLCIPILNLYKIIFAPCTLIIFIISCSSESKSNFIEPHRLEVGYTIPFLFELCRKIYDHELKREKNILPNLAWIKKYRFLWVPTRQ